MGYGNGCAKYKARRWGTCVSRSELKWEYEAREIKVESGSRKWEHEVEAGNGNKKWK